MLQAELYNKQGPGQTFTSVFQEHGFYAYTLKRTFIQVKATVLISWNSEAMIKIWKHDAVSHASMWKLLEQWTKVDGTELQTFTFFS